MYYCSLSVFSITYRFKNYNHIFFFFLPCFRDEEKPKNPMVELFYGRFLAVGVLEGMVTHVYSLLHLKGYYVLTFVLIVTF